VLVLVRRHQWIVPVGCRYGRAQLHAGCVGREPMAERVQVLEAADLRVLCVRVLRSTIMRFFFGASLGLREGLALGDEVSTGGRIHRFSWTLLRGLVSTGGAGG